MGLIYFIVSGVKSVTEWVWLCFIVRGKGCEHSGIGLCYCEWDKVF
jgi:hypothetical protein